MKILVLNCGSSSVKYQLIDTSSNTALAKGNVTRIGLSGSLLQHQPHGKPEIKTTLDILDHTAAVEKVIAILTSSEHGVIRDKKEIDAVGHRVVHGGERFTQSVLITPELMTLLRELIELAPLHNPHNIRGINACEAGLPGVPQVAVFDTAFHHNMEPHAYVYGIPYVFYKRYGIRRYGFHGTSHRYVSERAAAMLGRPIEELSIITAHLGNGSSIAAVKGGISIDTSMGFTPLEGLLMGTRSGDMDPAVILHIMAREELTLHEGNALLNKHSGLIGISGVSSDVREVTDAADKGNENAKLALDVMCYRLKKYIGAYAAAMGGVDALVYTAGIGENSAPVRKMSSQGLEFLGIKIDDAKNQQARGKEIDISAADATTRTLVIPTNEELVIALDTQEIIAGKKKR